MSQNPETIKLHLSVKTARNFPRPIKEIYQHQSPWEDWVCNEDNTLDKRSALVYKGLSFLQSFFDLHNLRR